MSLNFEAVYKNNLLILNPFFFLSYFLSFHFPSNFPRTKHGLKSDLEKLDLFSIYSITCKVLINLSYFIFAIEYKNSNPYIFVSLFFLGSETEVLEVTVQGLKQLLGYLFEGKCEKKKIGRKSKN